MVLEKSCNNKCRVNLDSCSLSQTTTVDYAGENEDNLDVDEIGMSGSMSHCEIEDKLRVGPILCGKGEATFENVIADYGDNKSSSSHLDLFPILNGNDNFALGAITCNFSRSFSDRSHLSMTATTSTDPYSIPKDIMPLNSKMLSLKQLPIIMDVDPINDLQFKIPPKLAKTCDADSTSTTSICHVQSIEWDVHTIGTNSWNIDMAALPTLQNVKDDMYLNDFKNMRHVVDGSNSNIFKATYTNNSTVILKLLMKDPPDRKLAKKEFILEHQILMRISHPNVVGYIGGGMSQDRRQFLCLERLTGGTLASILNNPNRSRGKSPFSRLRVMEMALAFADALNYLHTGYHPDVTLIHRDLKPDNIGFTDKGMLKLMDFGLCACVRRRQDMNQTYAMTGHTGSIRYMAPEVLLCKSYNEMVDMYSFGIILWEMATGQTPYKRLTMADFSDRVCVLKERPQIESYGKNIPKALGVIISMSWHADSQRRLSAAVVRGLIADMMAENGPVVKTRCMGMNCSYF
eukprot:gene4896-9763_t